MDKKITLKDLDFDYDVSGKGTKVNALKDMGVHNMDFDSLEDQAVTIRDRDTMAQERIGIDALTGWLSERMPF